MESSQQASDVILPNKVEDKSVVCPNTSSGSTGTKGVYTVITDIETGRSYAVRAFRMYMQENVNDPTKPNGHMYVEFLIDTSQQKNMPHGNLAQDVTVKMPFPCWSTWWRAIDIAETPERKMSTRYIEAGYVPGTGQDAIFQQNVC